MSIADKAREAAEAAIQSAEKERNDGDKVVSVAPSPDGTIALTANGRLFLRSTDPSHFNDGRTARKWRWTPIDGPLD